MTITPEQEAERNLDPFPYVSAHNSRHKFDGTLDGKRLVFEPREGYEQDCTAYGIF